MYSKAAGSTATAGTTIESAKYNAAIDDIVVDLNAARPITSGGTGATSASDALVNLGTDVKTVYLTKAANYTAVAADNNAFIRFTAAATLSLTAAATLGANWHILVVADGADVVINPNGAETIDGAATITVQNGFAALIICDGTGFRSDLSNASPAQPFVDLGSASTTDLGAVASDSVRITGGVTITSFGTAPEGTLRFVRMAGLLRLTYNATSLILPGAADIITAANDFFIAKSLGSGNWVVLSYQVYRASPVRAFVNFNGSTAVIRKSGNVSSVVRNGVGDYTINFATALPDANYAIVANGGASTVDTTVSVGTSPTTTACRVFNVSGGIAADNTVINVAIIG